MRRAGGLLCLLAFAAPPPAVRFSDETKKAGLRFVLDNSATAEHNLIETMAGGVAVFDYDGDGRPDIYFVNGAAFPSLEKTSEKYWNRLYRNNGDGTFTDMTSAAGVAGRGYGIAAAAADYDNDGRVDLFVAGVNGNTLYHNNGGGTFTAAAPPRAAMWAVAGGWFDFDNDGRLDLFVVNYVAWEQGKESYCGDRERGVRAYCHPRLYGALPNSLYRNNGDGTFTDISRQTGLAAVLGKGMSVSFGDANGDGWLDVFVTNDTLPNYLFLNEQGKRLREAGLESGVAFNDDGRALSSMGSDFRDFDNDGREDVLVTALANETFPLFRNLGRGLFADVTHASSAGRLSLERSGWGVGLFDFDNDGLKDIFTADGDVQNNSEMFTSRKTKQSNSVWRNRGGAAFEDVSAEAGLERKAQHRGAAFGDFDGDGRMDVVVTALGEAPSLLRNATANANHWLGVRLEGTRSNRQGIGAMVRVTGASGREQWNRVTTAVGYASSSEAMAHFGMGTDARARAIEVRWPSGAVQRLEDVAADRYLTVREP